MPCTYKGEPSGFEYYYNELEPADLSALGIPDDLPVQVTLVTHSSFSELTASSIAAAVLANVTGGLLIDTESGERHVGTGTLEWAKLTVEQCDDALSKPAPEYRPKEKKPWWNFW